MAQAKDNTVSIIQSASNDLEVLAKQFGTGLEEVTARDQVISRIAILQPLSPQINTDPNAKPGLICDTGLGTVYPGPVSLLPVHFTKKWLQWGPRGSGRGLVKIHDTPDILEDTNPDERGRPVLPSKDYIAETAQLYVINLTDNNQRGYVSFTSTQLKKSRQLMTKIANFRIGDIPMPIFARAWNFSAAQETNNQGTWWGWKIDEGLVYKDGDDYWKRLMVDVGHFRSAITAGAVKADMSDIAHEAERGGGRVIDNDDDIPF